MISQQDQTPSQRQKQQRRPSWLANVFGSSNNEETRSCATVTSSNNGKMPRRRSLSNDSIFNNKSSSTVDSNKNGSSRMQRRRSNESRKVTPVTCGSSSSNRSNRGATNNNNNNNNESLSSSSSRPSRASASRTTYYSQKTKAITNTKANTEQTLNGQSYHYWYLQSDPIQINVPITFANEMSYKECELYYASVHPERYDDFFGSDAIKRRASITSVNQKPITANRRIQRRSSIEFKSDLQIQRQRNHETPQTLKSCLKVKVPPAPEGGSSGIVINHDYKHAKDHFPRLVQRKDKGELHDSLKKFNESWNKSLNIAKITSSKDDFNISEGTLRTTTERLHQSLEHLNADDYEFHHSHSSDDAIKYNNKRRQEQEKQERPKIHVMFAKQVSVTSIYPFYEIPQDIWHSIWTPHAVFKKQMKQSKREYREEKRQAKREEQAKELEEIHKMLQQAKLANNAMSKQQDEEDESEQQGQEKQLQGQEEVSTLLLAKQQDENQIHRMSQIEQEILNLPLDDDTSGNEGSDDDEDDEDDEEAVVTAGANNNVNTNELISLPPPLPQQENKMMNKETPPTSSPSSSSLPYFYTQSPTSADNNHKIFTSTTPTPMMHMSPPSSPPISPPSLSPHMVVDKLSPLSSASPSPSTSYYNNKLQQHSTQQRPIPQRPRRVSGGMAGIA